MPTKGPCDEERRAEVIGARPSEARAGSMLWCLCADYLTGAADANWVYQGANHATKDESGSGAIIHAAYHAIRTGDRRLLDCLSRAVFLEACPRGDETSENERERRVALLCQEIHRRRYTIAAKSLLPVLLPDFPRKDPDTWGEYKENGKRWYEEHREAMAHAFYRWAAESPEADKESNFTNLSDALAAVWGNGRVLSS